MYFSVDAPLSIYGDQDRNVLSDSNGDDAADVSIALYGMLGDICVGDKDCFMDNSICGPDNRCKCGTQFQPTPDNVSCQGKQITVCLF